MGNLIYSIAILLVVVWAVCFIGLGAGGMIHVLLIVPFMAMLLKIIAGHRPDKNESF